MEKTKNLIKDILTHLKDNEEARERFKKQMGFDFFGNDLADFKENGLNELHDFEKQIILIHALSSPNGKPICGFLYNEAYEDGLGDKWIINHAKTLRTIYLEDLDEGKSYDEAYKLINEKYNEIL